MTNVPGIVPQPYPIVNYPGTFAIILRKVATPFFLILGSPDRKSADFSGNIFRRKNFRRSFFLADIFRTAVGRPSDGRRTPVGQRSDDGRTAVRRPSDVRPTTVR